MELTRNEHSNFFGIFWVSLWLRAYSGCRQYISSAYKSTMGVTDIEEHHRGWKEKETRLPKQRLVRFIAVTRLLYTLHLCTTASLSELPISSLYVYLDIKVRCNWYPFDTIDRRSHGLKDL